MLCGSKMKFSVCAPRERRLKYVLRFWCGCRNENDVQNPLHDRFRYTKSVQPWQSTGGSALLHNHECHEWTRNELVIGPDLQSDGGISLHEYDVVHTVSCVLDVDIKSYQTWRTGIQISYQNGNPDGNKRYVIMMLSLWCGRDTS